MLYIPVPTLVPVPPPPRFPTSKTDKAPTTTPYGLPPTCTTPFLRSQRHLLLMSRLRPHFYNGPQSPLAHFCRPFPLPAPKKKDAGVTHVSRPAAVIEGIIARLQRGSNRAIGHEAGSQPPCGAYRGVPSGSDSARRRSGRGSR